MLLGTARRDAGSTTRGRKHTLEGALTWRNTPGAHQHFPEASFQLSFGPNLSLAPAPTPSLSPHSHLQVMLPFPSQSPKLIRLQP